MRLFDRPRPGDDSQPERAGRRGKHRRGAAPDARTDDATERAAEPGGDQAAESGRRRLPYGSPPRVARQSRRDQAADDGRDSGGPDSQRTDAPAAGGKANGRRRAAPPRPGRRGDAAATSSAQAAPRADARARPAQPRAEAPAGQRRRRDAADAWADQTGQPRDRSSMANRDGGRGRDARAAPERPERAKVDWKDFALGDALPRMRPHAPDAPNHGDGRRHCGSLENVIVRQWDDRVGPPTPEAVRAVDSLAELPPNLKEKLSDGLDGIYVGMGGVPELDDMGHLRGVDLPSGKATWDICAGAYGDRKIVVGDQPSPTPDVMLHEIGHALDDIDGSPGEWHSDSPEFRAVYEQCAPRLVSDFHRQTGDLGRREFFADAFAAIASRQRPALVDMLGGDTRAALNVMLFFNRRYGI
jgi:hypothetical protein